MFCPKKIGGDSAVFRACSRRTFSAQRRKKEQSGQTVFSLAERTLYDVKYSELYFTWKLCRKGRADIELCGCKNAEDESR